MIITGLAAPVGVTAQVRPRWRERIERGALRWAASVPVLLGHDSAQPLGRATLVEGPEGVRLRASVPDSHPLAAMIRDSGADAWALSVELRDVQRRTLPLEGDTAHTAVTGAAIGEVSLLPRGRQAYPTAVVDGLA